MKIAQSTLQDLFLMETYFGNIQLNKNVSTNIRGIERIINRVFDLNVSIQIVDNNSGKFFGMTVTPERMDRILMAILEEKSTKDKLYEVWREEKNWVIEIDDLLLYDRNLNASPAEIVAVLLHEIGHVVYSNEAVSRANRVIKMTLLEAGAKYRNALSNEKFRPLLQLPLYESCSTKRFRIPTDVNKEEYIADRFVLSYGYGHHLTTFINKLIKTRGNSLIDRTSESMDKDVEILVKWTVENIASLQFRKDRLKHAMKLEEQRNPSKVVKQAVNNIRTSIFGKSEERELINEIMKEQYMIQTLDRLLEKNSTIASNPNIKNPGMLTKLFNSRRLKKIETKELDIIEVEIDRIEFHDDKIYVLELIHDLDDKIVSYLELIDLGHGDRIPQSKETLLSLKDRVKDMRARTIQTKIADPNYGLFIKYPNGYEG